MSKSVYFVKNNDKTFPNVYYNYGVDERIVERVVGPSMQSRSLKLL